MTWTPSCTLGNADRSQGPVTTIPILPELNRLAYAESVGSRYMDLSVTAIFCRVVSDFSPAGESNAAFLLSAVRIWPSASQSSASQCHTVSSEPGVTYAVPNCLMAGSVSFFASAWNGDQVRDADHLALDRGHVPLADPEVVPVDPRTLDHLGQVHHLRDLRHVRSPRPVEVGDVRRAAAADRGQHLLQRVVVVDVQAADLLARVLLLVLGDQVRERLGLGPGPAFPDRDAGPAAASAAVAVGPARGQPERECRESYERTCQGGPQPVPRHAALAFRPAGTSEAGYFRTWRTTKV